MGEVVAVEVGRTKVAIRWEFSDSVHAGFSAQYERESSRRRYTRPPPQCGSF